MSREIDNLEQQLEARDPDVRLMVQVRNDVPGPSRPWSSVPEPAGRHLVPLVGNRKRPRTCARRSSSAFTRRARATGRGRSSRPGCSRSPTTWRSTTCGARAATRACRSAATTARSRLAGRQAARRPRGNAVGPDAPGRAGRSGSRGPRHLNEDQKLAVLLNKFEEMSYAEIADVMSRSPAPIKSLLARARNQLREQLEPYLAHRPARTGTRSMTPGTSASSVAGPRPAVGAGWRAGGSGR